MSGAASDCAEPVGSWGARGPKGQWPEPLPRPEFVLEVCSQSGDLRCFDGRTVDWVPRWSGAQLGDIIVYSVAVERVEGPDGFRVEEVFDVPAFYRPTWGEERRRPSDVWEIVAALNAAADQW